MTFPQEDTLSMIYAVKSTCEKFQSTWTTNAVYAASYNLLAAKVPLIEQNRDLQMQEIKGITVDKKNKRVIMVEKAAFIQNRIQSYANVTNNPELLGSVNYTPSKMRIARDTEIVGICNTIFAKGTANAAALVNYGVIAAMLTELQAAITTYASIVAKPKTAKSQTKNATENLSVLFKEVDHILTKRLDLDIELFKVTKPDFYSQYKTARIVVSTGGNKLSLKGSVTIADTGEPLKGVVFTFIPENNGQMRTASSGVGETIVKKSAQMGNFRIPNMPEGTYIVTIKKIGFKDQVLKVVVTSGEMTILKIEMEKN